MICIPLRGILAALPIAFSLSLAGCAAHGGARDADHTSGAAATSPADQALLVGTARQMTGRVGCAELAAQARARTERNRKMDIEAAEEKIGIREARQLASGVDDPGLPSPNCSLQRFL